MRDLFVQVIFTLDSAYLDEERKRIAEDPPGGSDRWNRIPGPAEE